MPLTPRLKRIVLACLVAAAVCALGYVMVLENIHGGSEFSRTMLVVMFPTVALALKYELFGNVGFLAAVICGYVLWVLVVYLVLAVVQAYDDG